MLIRVVVHVFICKCVCRSARMDDDGEKILRSSRRASARHNNQFGYEEDDDDGSSGAAVGEKRQRRETLPDIAKRIPLDRLRPCLNSSLVNAAKVSEIDHLEVFNANFAIFRIVSRRCNNEYALTSSMYSRLLCTSRAGEMCSLIGSEYF